MPVITATPVAPWVGRHAVLRWHQRHGVGGAIRAIKKIIATGKEVGPETGPAWCDYRPDSRYFIPADGREIVVVVREVSPGQPVAITVLTPLP